jgi:hypothetical protein
MKKIRYVAAAALLTVGTFCAVLYSSCSKSSTDPCSSVTCKNGGVCSSGACVCKSGYGGVYCDTAYRTLYANTYKGNGQDNGTPTNTYSNYTLTLINPNDTNYISMTATGKFSDGTVHFTAPIILSNFSLTGTTTFTLASTTYNGFIYTGTGTVSATSASLTLNEDSAGHILTYTFSSMAKQ